MAEADEASTRRSARPICIPILGMHRSGTSALTRVVNLLGASLGGNLMGATPANPRGHWERLDVYDLHQTILSELGTSWDDWRSVDPALLTGPRGQTWRARLAHLLQAEFAGTPLFAIKDPRTCRLLPLWKAAVEDAGFDMRPMLTIRNPLEVADSLNRREPIRREAAIRTWLTHVLEAEHHSRGLRRAFVTYEGLLQDWAGTMTAAARHLAIVWPRIDEPITRRVVALFLNPGDRHHAYPMTRLPEDALEEAAMQVYAALIEASKQTASDGDVSAAFDQTTESCRALLDVQLSKRSMVIDMDSKPADQ